MCPFWKQSPVAKGRTATLGIFSLSVKIKKNMCERIFVNYSKCNTHCFECKSLKNMSALKIIFCNLTQKMHLKLRNQKNFRSWDWEICFTLQTVSVALGTNAQKSLHEDEGLDSINLEAEIIKNGSFNFPVNLWAVHLVHGEWFSPLSSSCWQF